MAKKNELYNIKVLAEVDAIEELLNRSTLLRKDFIVSKGRRLVELCKSLDEHYRHDHPSR